jgi:hypothetical protein
MNRYEPFGGIAQIADLSLNRNLVAQYLNGGCPCHRVGPPRMHWNTTLFWTALKRANSVMLSPDSAIRPTIRTVDLAFELRSFLTGEMPEEFFDCAVQPLSAPIETALRLYRLMTQMAEQSV